MTEPINESFVLIPDGVRRCLLRWTVAEAALESWVFVDGLRIFGPLLLDTLEREVPIPLVAGCAATIEIHDVATETAPTPIHTTATTRPTIQWNPSPDAARYRLYHRERSGSERRIFDRPASDFQGLPISIDAPIDLNGVGGIWHFLRVEAVDAYGQESTRLAWRYFAVAPPAPTRAIMIADGTMPGHFTLTITP